MGYVICPCGNRVSDNQSPSQNKGWLVTDLEEDRISVFNEYTLIDVAMPVWECHACGRLGIEGNGSLKWYAPEDGAPGYMMKANTEAKPTREAGSA